MKKSKYAEKVTDKIEDMLIDLSLSDDYTVDDDVRTVNGVKHPFFIIEYDATGRELAIDLFDAYTRHEEEEISINDSIIEVKISVNSFIARTRNENLSANLDEDLDDLDEDLNEEDEIEDENSFDDDFEDIESELDPETLFRNMPINLSTVDPSEEPVFSAKILNKEALSPSLLRNALILQDFGNLVAVGFYKTASMSERVMIFKDDFIRRGRTDDDIRAAIAHNVEDNPRINAPSVMVGSIGSYSCIRPIDAIMSSIVMDNTKDMLGTEDFYILFTPDDNMICVKCENLSYDGAKRAIDSINRTYIANGYDPLTERIYEYDFNTNLVVLAPQEREQEATEAQEAQEENRPEEIPYTRPSLNSTLQGENPPQDSPAYVDIMSSVAIQENELDLDLDPCYPVSGSETDEDRPSYDSNYFADYDTNSATEFAETMKELFNWRLGSNFHLEGNMLVNANGSIRMDMNDANHEYQTNEMDFLQFGDVLVDEYNQKEADLIVNTPTEASEEDLDYDDLLPFF